MKKSWQISVIILVVVAVLGLGYYYHWENSQEKPPTFSLMSSEAFQGMVRSGSTGFLKYTASDVSGWTDPSNTTSIQLKKDTHFYYAETATTIKNIVDSIEPVLNNEILILFYSPGEGSREEGYHSYPDISDYVSDDSSTPVNGISESAKNTFTIPAYRPFVIISRYDTTLWNIGRTFHKETEKATNYTFSNPLGTGETGWVMIPGNADNLSFLVSFVDELESVYKQNGENSFTSVDLNGLGSSSLSTLGYYMVWLKVSGDTPIGGDDPTVNLSVSPTTPIAEDGGTATVTATLSEASTEIVTVNLEFSGTATLDTDYSVSAATIAIPAGDTTGDVTITGIDDDEVEVDETIVVDIDTVTNATIGTTAQVTVTMTSEDVAAPLAVTGITPDICTNNRFLTASSLSPTNRQINVTFNYPISIGNTSAIKLIPDGHPFQNKAVLTGANQPSVSGNVLTVTYENNLGNSGLFEFKLEAGAVVDTDSNPNTLYSYYLSSDPYYDVLLQPKLATNALVPIGCDVGTTAGDATITFDRNINIVSSEKDNVRIKELTGLFNDKAQNLLIYGGGVLNPKKVGVPYSQLSANTLYKVYIPKELVEGENGTPAAIANDILWLFRTEP